MQGRTLVAGALLGSLALAVPARRNQDGHREERRGACLLPGRLVVRDGPPADPGEGARARARQRPAQVGRGLGSRRVRQARPARRRLGLVRRERARFGIRAPGRAARGAGVPLPRQRIERRTCRSTSPASRRRRRRRFSLVDVATPRAPTGSRLQALGLDVTEHGDANSVDGRCSTAAPTPAPCARRASATASGSPTSRRRPAGTRAATPRTRAPPSPRGCRAGARPTGTCPTTTSR